MNFGQLVLDFDGVRAMGERPFLLIENDLAALEIQLKSAQKRFPNGGAVGFFSYEAAQLFEPRAFSGGGVSPAFPLFRLQFFENLKRESAPPQVAEFPSSRELPEFSDVRDFYQNGVQTIREFIAQGDIYQANLTSKIELQTPFSPREIYARLPRAPRSAFLEWDDFALVSNSPETFLTLQNGVLESKPIKGTLARNLDPQILQNDAKNRAENVMIVDLLRNDLGRVCEFGSVHVPQLFEIETFPTLHHLVSTVRGRLRPEISALEAFKAAFPCGSITGAPKIRAMQILSEIEKQPRGASMGAIGYFGFDGSMNWSVAIRTATIFPGGHAQFHVGGGIVADSTPESEYEEMRLKARALWSALQSDSTNE